MSEPWWRRKKKKDSWFNDVYEELERLGDLIDATIQKAFENSSEKRGVHKSRVRGFSMKVGPHEKPNIQYFNRKLREKTKINEDPDPLIDLIEDAENVIVLASLPGVKREAIDIRATKNRLTVSVDTPNLKYNKELKLPAKIYPKSARASYKNGVLEIKLKKLQQSAKNEKVSVNK